MAPNVEAGSLSDITQLAGNPPKYPRNPTEVKRQPLTLYIARIPGSRDIILTTLKPQLKNVTAADVASSLYFLHLNTADDARLLEEESGLTSEEPTLEKPLPRKPLPGAARSSLEFPRKPLPESALSRHVTVASRLSRPRDSSALPRRKPVGSQCPTPNRPQVIPQRTASVGRKPLAPRALQSEYHDERREVHGPENYRTDSSSQDQRVLPGSSNDLTEPRNPIAGSATKERDSSSDFSITIIRRDPLSGAQWNIGTVDGQPAIEEAQSQRSTSTSRPKRPYFDLSVHLTTPGYAYFRHPSQNNHIGSGVTTLPSQPRTNSGFDRQVRMEGISFWNRSSMHLTRTLSDLSDRPPITRGKCSSGSFSADRPAIPLSLDDSQAKGYTFLSPWGGRCKFSTGPGGRSLRCKHSLPAPSRSMADSSISVQPPAIVSDLRFNLPSSAIFTQSATAAVSRPKSSGVESKRFSIPTFRQIGNRLSSHDNSAPSNRSPRPHSFSFAAIYPSDEEGRPPLPARPCSQTAIRDSSEEDVSPILRSHRPYSYTGQASEEEEEGVRLDLSIGKENAGGGTRGKRVKLGKLIIYDEGLKMLDLVVASNMGVWWSVWESENR
ncbi:hypothetical protein QTJ16_002062 [Diplocarpon rosae]|uniref:Uncharacterized protein n=1 Tax=Diplocarpon rosae TaxID=946125 RepID=A0AAD9T5I2_9HELO|nr:hypothetical protein QTJ16_002062 [Diplocarpon rosae]